MTHEREDREDQCEECGDDAMLGAGGLCFFCQCEEILEKSRSLIERTQRNVR